MKNYFTILSIFFIAFVSKTYAQGDFAPIGAKWHYTLLRNDEDVRLQPAGYTIIESVKDTVVSGQLCRKLQRIEYTRPYNSTAPPTSSLPLAMYVYSNIDTVFFFNEELGRFVHRYVFNLVLGDTIYFTTPPMYLSNNNGDTTFRTKITEVSNINVNGTSLKKVNHISLDYIMADPYVEKLGVLYGELFDYIGNMPAIYTLPYLRCYQDNAISYRRDMDIPCEFIDGPTSLANTPGDKDAILIFPNPSSNQIQVRPKGASNLNIQILEVYDVMGRKVAQVNVNKSAGTIDVSNVAKGVYWLKIILNDISYSRKIVVN